MSPKMSTTTVRDFQDRLREAWEQGTLRRLVLGAYRGSDRSLRKLQVRPVLLQSGRRLSFVWNHETRDITKNLEIDAGFELIGNLIGSDFASGHLYTTAATWQLEHRPGRHPRLTRSAPITSDTPVTLAHDHSKARTIQPDEPWLRSLGILGGHGEVRKAMESKYRQIHRFIELVDPILNGAVSPDDGAIRVVDMGCGKGYLTFALCSHLIRKYPGREIQVRGVEVRPELVTEASRAAADCGMTQLQFREGDIVGCRVEPTTGVVALHACDTATDDAMAWGVRAGAQWILTAPCCHREIRPQLTPPPPLAGALRHGIFAERQAEFVTDALRSALLEWVGYETRVMEFVSPEHTVKNLMIAAIRRPSPRDVEALRQAVSKLAGEYGVRRQHLATQLGFQWESVPGSR